MARITVPYRKNQDVDKKIESIIFISNTVNTSNSNRISNKFAFSLLFINVVDKNLVKPRNKTDKLRRISVEENYWGGLSSRCSINYLISGFFSSKHFIPGVARAFRRYRINPVQ